ncbi:oxygen-independent coproporphyrinogen III oxidase [bacterium]|nr:oxygen-independent coproporphyrinogen III oxidase [bacterium]
MTLTLEQLEAFDIPGPRYTSYPTAPQWQGGFPVSWYQDALYQSARHQHSVSVYIHIPFCTRMCYYCGCNVIIRKPNESVGDSYITYLFKEMALATRHLSGPPCVKQVHLGGGTPNYLSPVQLTRLLTGIRETFSIEEGSEIAVEVDPRTLTEEQVATMAQLGVTRISMGIQDTNPIVQSRINRVQPIEMVNTTVGWVRRHGLSLNFDLIYGLPMQEPDGMCTTISHVLSQSPDRIALYSYAHVPWLKSHQALLHEKDLPTGRDKLGLFLLARDALLAGGYVGVGMDHFARPEDPLAIAYQKGTLYRNFMGYTVKPADDALGFGVTAIGHVEGHYVQNTKDLSQYCQALDEGYLPVDRGMRLSHDDRMRQWVIQSIMCRFQVELTAFTQLFSCDLLGLPGVAEHLSRCEADGLVIRTKEGIQVTELGKLFVRIVAMGFDAYLSQHRGFSRTI